MATHSPKTVGTVASGRLTVDGNRLIPVDGDVIRERYRATYQGAAFVTVILNGSGRLAAEPELFALGLLEGNERDISSEVCRAVSNAIEQMHQTAHVEDDIVCETVRLAVRRAFRDLVGKKPVTEVRLVRV